MSDTVSVDCTLFKKYFFELFSKYFFSRNFVSAILEVCLELEFFVATFVVVLFNSTKARFVLCKTCPHIFASIHLLSISVNLVWADIVQGKLYIFF